MDSKPASRDRRGPLVVVPCLNEAGHLEGLLGRLLNDPGASDALIVVADAGSSDASRAIVTAFANRDRRVRLIDNPDRYQSGGVNRAARMFGAGRRWLVRIDAHAGYPSDYIARLVAEGERTGADSVVVAMRTVGESSFQRAIAAAMNSKLGTGGSAHRIGGAAAWVDHGHHALFDLRVFLAAGGYDRSFSHNEDAEFDERLGAAGGRIWLTDKVSADYYPRRTSGALFRQYFNYGKGRARTALRHRKPLKLRQLAPLAVAPALALAALAPVFGPAMAPAAIWAAACMVGGLVLAGRSRDLSVLAAGPAAMVMHMGWSLGFWSQLIAPRATLPRPALPRPAGAPV